MTQEGSRANMNRQRDRRETDHNMGSNKQESEADVTSSEELWIGFRRNLTTK